MAIDLFVIMIAVVVVVSLQQQNNGVKYCRSQVCSRNSLAHLIAGSGFLIFFLAEFGLTHPVTCLLTL